MKRKLKFFVVTLFIFLFNVINVNADDVEIASFSDLNELANSGGNAVLVNDIVMTDDVRLYEECTIDLNGHTLDTNVGFTLIVRSNVTIKDTNGNGKITNGQLEGEYTSSDYQSLQVGGKISSTEMGSGSLTIESGNYEAKYVIHMAKGNLTINGGNFKGTTNLIIGTNSLDFNSIEINGGVFNYTGGYQAISLINASVVMNNGTIKSTNGSGIVGFKDSTVTINNGTIEGYDYAIAGNGSPEGANNDGTNAKFTINGGTLKASDGLAIYAPQINGETKITGGTLIGSDTGIEVRAGKLIVSGGSITGNTNEFTSNANGNGPSTTGAGIAVSQHTTKEAIDVSISGGTITGAAAFAIVNPQNNSAEDLEKITVNITNGTFKGTIISDNINGFISGGNYNSTPADFVKIGYVEYTENDEDYVVLPSQSYEIEEDEFFVKLGGSINYTPSLNEIYDKYIKVSTLDKTIATYSNGYINGIKEGETFLTVNLGHTGDSKKVYVYDVKAEKNDNINANNVAADILEKALNEESVDGISNEMIETIKEAIIAGNEISTNVEVNEINKDDIDETDLEKINSLASEKGITISKFLDINVSINIEGESIGYITKLSKDVDITVDLSDDEIKSPDGYNRQFYVIRLHEGEEPKLIKATLNGNKLTFKTDEFSTYVVTYTDTKQVSNPKTGDDIYLYISLVVVSIFGFIIKNKKIRI